MSNVRILKESPGAPSARRAPLAAGAFWTRFGVEVLVCASDQAAAETAGVEWGAETVGEESIDPEELFLVLQKGRLFQQENPDAWVILDKGRFLVVHLPRAQREMVQVSEAPCYTI